VTGHPTIKLPVEYANECFCLLGAYILTVCYSIVAHFIWYATAFAQPSVFGDFKYQSEEY